MSEASSVTSRVHVPAESSPLNTESGVSGAMVPLMTGVPPHTRAAPIRGEARRGCVRAPRHLSPAEPSRAGRSQIPRAGRHRGDLGNPRTAKGIAVSLGQLVLDGDAPAVERTGVA